MLIGVDINKDKPHTTKAKQAASTAP
jgi:hypothetical protein